MAVLMATATATVAIKSITDTINITENTAMAKIVTAEKTAMAITEEQSEM